MKDMSLYFLFVEYEHALMLYSKRYVLFACHKKYILCDYVLTS